MLIWGAQSLTWGFGKVSVGLEVLVNPQVSVAEMTLRCWKVSFPSPTTEEVEIAGSGSQGVDSLSSIPFSLCPAELCPAARAVAQSLPLGCCWLFVLGTVCALFTMISQSLSPVSDGVSALNQSSSATIPAGDGGQGEGQGTPRSLQLAS